MDAPGMEMEIGGIAATTTAVADGCGGDGSGRWMWRLDAAMDGWHGSGWMRRRRQGHVVVMQEKVEVTVGCDVIGGGSLEAYLW
uniref:Uncharacterized protein n=1 Tax=Oryza punctata TaxID=4537 RepID=A0A0E0LU45_ORYPU